MKHYLIPPSHSNLVTSGFKGPHVPEAWFIFYIQSMSLIILSLVDVI